MQQSAEELTEKVQDEHNQDSLPEGIEPEVAAFLVTFLTTLWKWNWPSTDHQC